MSHLNDLKNLDADTILGALGVQRKRTADWVAPAVGGLVVGAVVGAVVALLFTNVGGRAAARSRAPRGQSAPPLAIHFALPVDLTRSSWPVSPGKVAQRLVRGTAGQEGREG